MCVSVVPTVLSLSFPFSGLVFVGHVGPVHLMEFLGPYQDCVFLIIAILSRRRFASRFICHLVPCHPCMGLNFAQVEGVLMVCGPSEDLLPNFH